MEDPIVVIKSGKLRGKVEIDYCGGKYYSFRGIPYAKPPIGNLRFKAPLPPDQWSGIRDAVKHQSECCCRDLMFNQIIGSEDCLYLNVYTPQIHCESMHLKPVMFWIHGGGFVRGSGNSDTYGPDFLITQDVVIVTINYRLGILGFLNFEDPSLDVPGNAGLKDQVMGLKWVRENIANFGGDPSNVTIFGESAGAASVHLLMLSPLARGFIY
uniref:Carboxylic ester hydrolase n=1 Tax=Photinus pyralis TaxID=7054 RepID=A0A1Y1LSP7_PHOPY